MHFQTIFSDIDASSKQNSKVLFDEAQWKNPLGPPEQQDFRYLNIYSNARNRI